MRIFICILLFFPIPAFADSFQVISNETVAITTETPEKLVPSRTQTVFVNINDIKIHMQKRKDLINKLIARNETDQAILDKVNGQ